MSFAFRTGLIFLSNRLLKPVIITILSHQLASAMPSVTIERSNCPMSKTVNTQVPNDHAWPPMSLHRRRIQKFLLGFCTHIPKCHTGFFNVFIVFFVSKDNSAAAFTQCLSSHLVNNPLLTWQMCKTLVTDIRLCLYLYCHLIHLNVQVMHTNKYINMYHGGIVIIQMWQIKK